MTDQINGDLGTRVAIVENELGTVYGIFTRFEAALEKMTEVSSSLNQLIAVHDNRLMERERADSTIFEMMEKRKEEYSRGVERMHQKMEDLSTDLRKEIRAEINGQYDDLKEAVHRFEASQKDIAEKLDRRIEQTIEHRSRIVREINSNIEKMDTRVKKLEAWRWAVLGAGAVIGFIVGRWDFFSALLTH